MRVLLHAFLFPSACGRLAPVSAVFMWEEHYA